MISLMLILSAKPVVDAMRGPLQKRVVAFTAKHGRAPGLAVVLIGDDPASVIYTSKKADEARSLGMESRVVHLDSGTPPAVAEAKITELNRDPRIDGVLLQRPLPRGYSEESAMMWIAPEKDVDALHPESVGKTSLGVASFRPCTPAGILALLDYYAISLGGKLACVVGRSAIVGKPMASLLLQRDATVIHCHSKTPDLKAMTRQADILIVAAGNPGLISEEHIKSGAVVVDVGVHRSADGKLVGDVDFRSASNRASAISPVPGGVGPMTIALLLQNTMSAAESRNR